MLAAAWQMPANVSMSANSKQNQLSFVDLCIPALVRLLQSQSCEYRIFFFLTPGVWNLYLCSTFDSNKNTMCFKEKQRAIEGNTNIYKWTYTTCKGCDKASDQGLYSADFMQVTLLSPRVLRFGAEILDSRIVTMGDCGLNTQMNSCLLIPKGHWKGEGL